MKITVLGSSGQIGAYLTEYLRDKGHTVHEFDIVNGPEEDMGTIPNPLLEEKIADLLDHKRKVLASVLDGETVEDESLLLNLLDDFKK